MQSVSRPSRGAELWIQGGGSATAKAKLERDKRGLPLDCKKEKAVALFFFGLRGTEGGINLFSFCEKERQGNKPLPLNKGIKNTIQ